MSMGSITDKVAQDDFAPSLEKSGEQSKNMTANIAKSSSRVVGQERAEDDLESDLENLQSQIEKFTPTWVPAGSATERQDIKSEEQPGRTGADASEARTGARQHEEKEKESEWRDHANIFALAYFAAWQSRFR